MKYSGVKWIGEIPDKWNLVRLKDICINKKEVAITVEAFMEEIKNEETIHGLE